jgi:hypothetical protein
MPVFDETGLRAALSMNIPLLSYQRKLRAADEIKIKTSLLDISYMIA